MILLTNEEGKEAALLTVICSFTSKIGYPSVSEDGPKAGAGDGASTRRNPNFLMSSLAISSLALSDGWYSSQNTYLLLSLHSDDAGKHVRAGRILPNEQHGESALLNPGTIQFGRIFSIRKNK